MNELETDTDTAPFFLTKWETALVFLQESTVGFLIDNIPALRRAIPHTRAKILHDHFKIYSLCNPSQKFGNVNLESWDIRQMVYLVSRRQVSWVAVTGNSLKPQLKIKG